MFPNAYVELAFTISCTSTGFAALLATKILIEVFMQFMHEEVEGGNWQNGV